MNRFTEKEKNWLLENYVKKDWDVILSNIPLHSKNSIQNYCSKTLGLHRVRIVKKYQTKPLKYKFQKGQTIDYLTIDDVIYYNDNPNMPIYYRCTCKCGNVITKKHRYFQSQSFKSCGCYKIETAKINIKVAHKKNGEKIKTSHLFEENISYKGWSMKIIRYGSWTDLDVEFEDGAVSYSKNYSSFRSGNIAHPGTGNLTKDQYETLTNTYVTNTKGDKARICKWNSRGRVDIVFEDGTIKKDVQYVSFQKGNFLHPLWEPLSVEERGITDVLKNYENGAKDRGYAFKLTKKDIKSIVHQPCYYCGRFNSNKMLVSNSKKITDKYFYYNGIDRVDNSIGYIRSNVVPCCKICNIAKHALTQVEFYEWVQDISSVFTKEKVL